ncbi:anti-sigma regulatory factor (Ser/Thr protein kinase) [Murinocardiopsis flavida]|uniref:Anti-sigma regulatory factor (Ser/Thr protein kinase) n=1 Tax=Murinocardiopsis flavida TaxID=645275 RepID=A0A2P8D250_9ACTN|nr:ATP-binding protein [Murinocardiopsis flavida]PSK91292.1 anti-sigma regulatory factor (Ser/Thr protein kinase) [Murinocardiopsis flavida]
MAERSPDPDPASGPHPSPEEPHDTTADPVAVRRRFPGLANQIRHARRFVARQLGDTPTAATATLLTSELATNAVTHSASGSFGGKFEVAVYRADTWVRVEVRDLGSSEQPRAQHRDPYDASENGRGLDLVEALAEKWGTDPRPDGMGRLVWFELTWEDHPAPEEP